MGAVNIPGAGNYVLPPPSGTLNPNENSKPHDEIWRSALPGDFGVSGLLIANGWGYGSSSVNLGAANTTSNYVYTGTTLNVTVMERMLVDTGDAKRTPDHAPEYEGNRGSGTAWNNVRGVEINGGAGAIITLGSNQTSAQLLAENFGFLLPPGAVLLGMEIEVERELLSGSVASDSAGSIVCGWASPMSPYTTDTYWYGMNASWDGTQWTLPAGNYDATNYEGISVIGTRVPQGSGLPAPTLGVSSWFPNKTPTVMHVTFEMDTVTISQIQMNFRASDLLVFSTQGMFTPVVGTNVVDFPLYMVPGFGNYLNTYGPVPLGVVSGAGGATQYMDAIRITDISFDFA